MTEPCESPIPGWNMLLMGGSGTGKTYSIRTMIDAGITPMCLFLEPGFEVLGDIPSEKLKWHYIKPAGASWSSMAENHRKLNTMSFESLSKMAPTDKREYFQFVELHRALNNYTDDRTGECFGDAGDWNTDRCLVIDGLSGLSIMAMREWVGSKNLLGIGDWGVAMNGLEQFLQKCCFGTACHFMLIAHTEREITEDTQTSKIMPSTLGRKLSPKLNRFFSDCVLSKREGSKFTWDTADSSADLKARNLPIKEGLDPSFVPVTEKWKKQSGVICPSLPYVKKA